MANVCVRKKGGKFIAVVGFKDPEGKWRQRSRTLKATAKRAATAEAQTFLDSLGLNADGTERRALTVSELMDRYIDFRAPTIEPSTLSEYRRAAAHWIVPALGGRAVSELTPETVAKWQGRLNETYSAQTCKKSLTLFRSAVRWAMNADVYTGKDPTRGVRHVRDARRQVNALDAAGAAVVLDATGVNLSSPYMLADRLALCAGLRKGEACALRWADVDVPGRALTVRRAIGRADGRGWYVKEPKTGESGRTVYFGAALVDALEARRTRVAEAFGAAALPFNENAYVLGGIDGRFMAPVNVSNRWRALAEGLELVGTQGARPTFHDLRHTYATLLIGAGTDVKTVSALLGHSNAAMTLNVYADATQDQKRRAAGAIDAVTGAVARA
jgi:integrase